MRVHRKLKIAFAWALLATSVSAEASLTDCSDLHVGSIWLEQGQGLYAVVLLQNEGDASGSYWMFFTQFSADERKSALATLTAAKLANHRVHVKTHAADQCSILATSQYVKSLYMAHRP
jgi:hypothetical protein